MKKSILSDTWSNLGCPGPLASKEITYSKLLSSHVSLRDMCRMTWKGIDDTGDVLSIPFTRHVSNAFHNIYISDIYVLLLCRCLSL